MHPLSPYTPICRACGLVLCELNLPHHACPHCAEPLLAPPAREELVRTLETRIDEALAREEAARQRALEEARAAQGAFPTLAAGASRAAPEPVHPANQAHKVMSLNAKTKRYEVSVRTPSPLSRPASAGKTKRAPEPEFTRVPPPPKEVAVASGPPRADRPWANTRGLNVAYAPPTRVG